MRGSNRTIVGLKRDDYANALPVSTRSNRTIVGLKLQSCSRKIIKKVKQQSHHCGIETSKLASSVRLAQSGSNRTIVGLKRLPLSYLPLSYLRSNRTIVGLKHCPAPSVSYRCLAGSNRTIVGLKP